MCVCACVRSICLIHVTVMFLKLQDWQGEQGYDYEDTMLFWRHVAAAFMACTALLIYGLLKETMGDGTLPTGNSKDVHWACRAASVLGCVSVELSFHACFFQLVGGAHG